VTADDPAAVLFVQLGRLIRTLRQEGEGAPVGPGAVSAMFTLGRHPDGMRLGALAQLEGVTAPSLTRIVNALEDRGYVERVPDPSDGRAQLAVLTDRGTALIASGKHARVAALRRRFEALGDDHRRRIEAALPALEALLDPPGN
jgi:DNA-binding MarR family transcriptional regulator